MFVDKRPRGLRMALRANRIFIRRRLDVIRPEGPMRIVAVGALHQSFVHLVMERLAESRLHVAVAAKAELRLGSLEQVWVLPRYLD